VFPASSVVTIQLLPVPAKRDGLFASPQKRNIVFFLLIVVTTLATYNPVNHHPFVNYDDDRYVYENLHVRAGLTWSTIAWAFTATEYANWHPLAWLSHAADCQFFGLNPAGHHFSSLLIHALNAAMLFLMLAWATGRAGPSLFVALVFALHPINVESVAWIAERKNVLCTFFFFAAIAAYGWYVRKPSWRRYLTVTALFAGGLMAKPMVITLPFVLLLWDYWPLSRRQASFRKLFLEKLPLLALSAASALITLHAQQAGGAMRSTVRFPFGLRIENAVTSYALYLWKTIWPAKLVLVYPYPSAVSIFSLAASVVALAGISVLVFRFRSRRYLLVGWLWFVGTLIPVIGLVQVGDAAMADRYAYIPLIGILLMIAWGLADLADAWKLGLPARLIPAACALILLAATTEHQLSYWSNDYELWAHTVSITGPNFVAQNNLGGALLLAGDPDAAYPHFEEAAKINPRDPMSHANIGAYLQDHGQWNAALAQYKIATRLTSDAGLLASTYANIGTTYLNLGDDEQAKQNYDRALQLSPSQPNAWFGLGNLAEKQGNLDDAIFHYSRAVELAPSANAYMSLGHALLAANRREEALAAFQAALKISPGLRKAELAVEALTSAGQPPH